MLIFFRFEFAFDWLDHDDLVNAPNETAAVWNFSELNRRNVSGK